MHSIFIPVTFGTRRLSRFPGKGSFVEAHVVTPQDETTFGSLVLVFPTPHEGGDLLFRHRGNEWSFEPGRDLPAQSEPCIGYVAFFNDVEHEVAQVTSGHRVTLTYNLYFDDDDDGRTVFSSQDATSARGNVTLPPAVNKNAFRKTFEELLENPEFLPDGGTLGFGMRHAYPIFDASDDPNPLEPIYGALKGSDAVVYGTARALGFQPMLYMYYQSDDLKLWRDDAFEDAVSDRVIHFDKEGWPARDADFFSVVLDRGGFELCEEGDQSIVERSERVEWVTPVTWVNRRKSQFVAYGNEPEEKVVYTDLCMFVRIGKAGERLMYPTISQLKMEREH